MLPWAVLFWFGGEASGGHRPGAYRPGAEAAMHIVGTPLVVTAGRD
jgi:hypothetical protein